MAGYKNIDPEAGKATQFKPGQSGNPAGMQPGTKHLSSWIQELGSDEEFEVYLKHPTDGYVPYKGAPIRAVVETAWQKAAAGDEKAREWLAKYGWRQQLDVTTNGKDLPAPILGGMSTVDVPSDHSNS